jgi:RIO kinase 1
LKKSKEKFKVYHDVFEPITIKALQKLNINGYFDYIEKEISIGKEANVFLAKKGDEKVVLKIYRIAVMDFKKLKDYFLMDPRFPKVRNSRYDLIFNWTKKEYRNLVKAYSNLVRVPTPITSYKNVLIESFIGDEIPAPKLKDEIPENPEDFFEDLIENVEKLVFNAKVIHGDLSEYNILNYKERPVIIDFSQSLPAYSPQAYQLLKRDLEKVEKFFKKYLKEDKVKEKINKILNRFKEEILQ